MTERLDDPQRADKLDRSRTTIEGWARAVAKGSCLSQYETQQMARDYIKALDDLDAERRSARSAGTRTFATDILSLASLADEEGKRCEGHGWYHDTEKVKLARAILAAREPQSASVALTDEEIIAAWNGAGPTRPEAGAGDLYLHYMRAVAKAQFDKATHNTTDSRTTKE